MNIFLMRLELYPCSFLFKKKKISNFHWKILNNIQTIHISYLLHFYLAGHNWDELKGQLVLNGYFIQTS